ncbi:MAG: hypothetical protein H5T42_06925 [Methanothrix sp.]|jgi:dolichol kinase|uniref:Dolichol kinase n=1 Tax=Methanothrix thermoacetophila (strain DSM 6194 / JCM 14653 / NBRC 101360 / PT) TaxID=349307 RepID=A0B5U3_METTP|nr:MULTISPECIES: hypothetical protein [Methanothrix]ABK14067.1 conserved hypothetical protein [Methanothrix thermoacetophila PT]MBC7080183.1 hypothetical protein [Methanothrix sp.]NPU87909.1 hypothetical protein [Methanothrix sp.]
MMAAENWRSSLIKEIRRKSIHLTGLSVPIILLKAGWYVTVGFVATALLVAVVLEALRLRGMIHLPEVRQSEQGRVAGYFFYISGCLLAVILFSEMVAALAILMLCIGDAASGIVGSVVVGSNVRDIDNTQLNSTRKRKPRVVAAAMLSVCVLLGFLTSGFTHLPPHVYLAGAAGATLADSVPLFIKGRSVDDNFAIPLVSGALMTAASVI